MFSEGNNSNWLLIDSGETLKNSHFLVEGHGVEKENKLMRKIDNFIDALKKNWQIKER